MDSDNNNFNSEKDPWENNDGNNQGQAYNNQGNAYSQPTNNYGYSQTYQPTGGYYQPPKKKKISTGAIIAIVLGCIFIVGIISLTILGAFGLAFVRESGIVDEAMDVFSQNIDDSWMLSADNYDENYESLVIDGVEYQIVDGEAKINRVYDYYCKKNLKIPKTVGEKKYPVTSVDDFAFFAARYIKEVTLPDTLTYIGDSAFESCKIVSIHVPESVNNIGDLAFYDSDIMVICDEGSFVQSYVIDNDINYTSIASNNSY